MNDPFSDVVNTSLWQEQPEADDPFSAAVCRASGYDVYGDLLGKIGYIDYLYLLFTGERPNPHQSRTLSLVAVALANPGPRDPSVHAAMAGGVAGTPAAACLMAALAPGAGSHGGAREVRLAMELWLEHGCNLHQWQEALEHPVAPARTGVWPHPEHTPGFSPYGSSCVTPVRQTLAALARELPHGLTGWLAGERRALEHAAALPLAMTGVAAATLLDLGFDAAGGEMLVLMLRLPGAAAHALEQQRQGFRQFPFFSLELQDDTERRLREVA